MAQQKRTRRTRTQVRKEAVPTDREQAFHLEGLVGKTGMSTSAVLIARCMVRRGYAGRARRPKVRIGYAADGEKR